MRRSTWGALAGAAAIEPQYARSIGTAGQSHRRPHHDDTAGAGACRELDTARGEHQLSGTGPHASPGCREARTPRAQTTAGTRPDPEPGQLR